MKGKVQKMKKSLIMNILVITAAAFLLSGCVSAGCVEQEESQERGAVLIEPAVIDKMARSLPDGRVPEMSGNSEQGGER